MRDGPARCMAVVLSAGASRRLGRPKATLPFAGTTNVRSVVVRLLDEGLKVFVVGRDGLDLDLQGLDCVHVVNPDPEAGRTGSLQVALHRLSDGYEEVLVCPVDRPGWDGSVVQALRRTPGEAVVPVASGRSGHPLLLRGLALQRVLEASPSTPLREAVGPRRQVEVVAPFLHLNLDRPEDVDHLPALEAWLRRGEGP